MKSVMKQKWKLLPHPNYEGYFAIHTEEGVFIGGKNIPKEDFHAAMKHTVELHNASLKRKARKP